MNPSTDKKLEIYCNETRCMVKKNELDGRVKVLETNAKRMIFQLPNFDDSLRISCKIDTEAQYLFDEYHASDITTVECKSKLRLSSNGRTILFQDLGRGASQFFLCFTIFLGKNYFTLLNIF